MKASDRKLGDLALHPLDRQASIGKEIRRRIIKGQLGSGDQLPSRQDLAIEFSTALKTCQKALSRLERDGFVVSRGRNGTFVADFPPHVFHLGLVFPRTVEAVLGNWYFNNLSHVAGEAPWLGPRRVIAYHNVRGEQGDEPDLVRLAQDVVADRLAGVIVTEGYSARSPALMRLLAHQSMPVVGILTEAAMPGMACVKLAGDQMMELAIDRLVRAGFTRPAIVCGMQGTCYWFDAHAAMARRGLPLLPWWRIEAATENPRTVRTAMRLLTRLPPADAPDSVIITDDNLVPDATAALVEAQSEALMRWKIVAHANFPMPTTSSLPALRLGFDAYETLAAAITVIDKWRAQGRKAVEDVVVLPRFQGELASPVQLPLPQWPAPAPTLVKIAAGSVNHASVRASLLNECPDPT